MAEGKTINQHINERIGTPHAKPPAFRMEPKCGGTGPATNQNNRAGGTPPDPGHKEEWAEPNLKEPRTMASVLREIADFAEARNDDYGSAYKMHGKIMAQLFPEGITLRTAEDFYHWHVYVLKVIKMTRIAVYWSRKGVLHHDSYLDDIVYGAMTLEELDKQEPAPKGEVDERNI